MMTSRNVSCNPAVVEQVIEITIPSDKLIREITEPAIFPVHDDNAIASLRSIRKCRPQAFRLGLATHPIVDAMIGELDADEALMGFVFFAVVFFDEFLTTMVLVLPPHSRFLSVL